MMKCKMRRPYRVALFFCILTSIQKSHPSLFNLYIIHEYIKYNHGRGREALGKLKFFQIVLSAASALLAATKSIVKFIECIGKMRQATAVAAV